MGLFYCAITMIFYGSFDQVDVNQLRFSQKTLALVLGNSFRRHLFVPYIVTNSLNTSNFSLEAPSCLPLFQVATADSE